MKIICLDKHKSFLEDKLKEYKELDIVLVEQGLKYKGLGYYFNVDEIEEVIEYLKEQKNHSVLIGIKDGNMYPINIKKIEYIEGFTKDCYFHTEMDEYLSEYKLFELEEKIKEDTFIRISKSVIVNINKILYIRPEFNSKYGLYMKSGIKLMLNRKYLKEFKNKIGKR